MNFSKTITTLACLAHAQIALGGVAGLNGVVGYEVHAFSSIGDPFLLADLEQIAFTDGVGQAQFSSMAPSAFSGGDIWMEVNQIDANTRSLSIILESDNTLNGFLVPGATIDGNIIGFLGWSFGMDTFGDFPGDPNLPFIDPDFVSLISSTGDAFDLQGNAFVGNGGTGLFTHDYGDGSFGGRVFYNSNDGADDLSTRGLSRFEATVTYSVPSPGPLSLYGLSVIAFCRRNR